MQNASRTFVCIFNSKLELITSLVVSFLENDIYDEIMAITEYI